MSISDIGIWGILREKGVMIFSEKKKKNQENVKTEFYIQLEEENGEQNKSGRGKKKKMETE